MSIGTAVTATIQPGRSDDQVEMTLEVSRNLSHPEPSYVVQPFHVSKDRMKEFAELFKQELDDLQVSFGNGLLGGSPQNAGRTLHGLHMAGINTAYELFGQDEAIRLQAILSTALSRARIDQPLLFELRYTQDCSFPLDLLPITPPRRASLPSSRSELQTLAESFPVFSCVVRRTLLDASTTSINDSKLYGAPEPSVALFWNEMAPSAPEDREYFEKRARVGSIRLAGPIPDAAFEEPNDVSKEKLVMQLLELPQFIDPDGSGEEFPYQLVHIAAHSQSGLPGITGRTVLILGKLTEENGFLRKPKRHRYPIKSGEISYLFKTMSDPIFHGPVGVLSSCRSTTWADKGMLGLVVPLLQAGYRSVVGFDTDIPGIVAHKLFTYAYNLMFDQKITLGEALSLAKTWLLLDMNNPLGILLRTYGQIDLAF